MIHGPISQFNQWWHSAQADTPLKHKSAVCISTLNEDGFPEGRFVDLKAVDEDGFVFCSYFDSDKGRQLAANPKCTMTVWWDHVGYQVRVVGHAERISHQQALVYWQSRNRGAQLTTKCFQQSQPIASLQQLH